VAKHIDNISELESLAVGELEFYRRLRSGMLLFCVGKAAISEAIQKATKSPLSHIGMVYMPCFEDGAPVGLWTLIEAVWPHGVGMNPLESYIEGPEDLILCARVDPSTGKEIDQRPAILAELKMCGRGYAALGLVKEGLHRLVPELPAECSTNEVYCSGLQHIGSTHTTLPFRSPDGGEPAPEDEFVDASVNVVAVLIKQATAADAKGAGQ
jgi:hypothetical protein